MVTIPWHLKSKIICYVHNPMNMNESDKGFFCFFGVKYRYAVCTHRYKTLSSVESMKALSGTGAPRDMRRKQADMCRKLADMRPLKERNTNDVFVCMTARLTNNHKAAPTTNGKNLQQKKGKHVRLTTAYCVPYDKNYYSNSID